MARATERFAVTPLVRVRRGLVRGAGNVFVWWWVLFSFAVLAWIVVAAFKRNDTVFQELFAPPRSLNLGNFGDAWDLLNLTRTSLNTLLTVGVGTFVTMALAAPAAYALSRIHFRGAGALTAFFALGISVPVHSIIIPLFIGLSDTGLSNSLLGLTLAYVGVSVPFAVFLMTGFFRSLPTELEEAAAMEGAGPVRIFAVGDAAAGQAGHGGDVNHRRRRPVERVPAGLDAHLRRGASERSAWGFSTPTAP